MADFSKEISREKSQNISTEILTKVTEENDCQ